MGLNMRKIRSVGMAEARPNLTQIVDEVSAGGDPYFIVSGSKIKAVLLGIDQFNDMIERLEDLADAAELLQAQVENEPTVSFEEHLAKSRLAVRNVPTRT
jgi:prevent-host-death family protein